MQFILNMQTLTVMYPHSGYFNIKTHKPRQYFPTAKNKPKRKDKK